MPKEGTNRPFFISLNRAVAGAIVFSFPLLMTMEMWWLGFHADRLRLALLLIALLPTLIGLSVVSGFDEHWQFYEALLDALVAVAVAAGVATLMLVLFGEVRLENSIQENVGKISLQMFPAAIGAMISKSLLDAKKSGDESKKHEVSLGIEMFLRFVGGLVLGLTAAPTEELVLIAIQISSWQAIVILLLSLLIMYSFIYGLESKLHSSIPAESLPVRLGLRSGIGYAIALLLSAWILWTFGRFDGAGLHQIVVSTVILGFATNLGAAAVRVVL